MKLFILFVLVTFMNPVACRLEIKPKTKSLVKPLNNSLLFTCEKVNDDGGYEDDEDGVDDFNGGRIKLKWFNKYGEEIVSSSGRIYVESGYNSIKLFITTIKEEDDGDYTCKNIASAVSDDNVEMASISLSVYKDITFEDAPEKQYIEIHSSSTIKCVVSGLPVPFVSWRFNGRKISPANKKFEILKDGLIVKNVSLQDEGTYYCRGEVDLNGAYSERAIKVRVEVPPSMTKHMLDVQEVAEAGNVTLSCSAHAMPSPTYQFFKTAKTKNNEMAQQGARIHSLPKKITIDPVKGIMVIMNVSKLTGDDDYIYQCLAVNKLGNDSSFGQIKILTPPVISLQPIVVTTKNSKVTIECASTGDPLPDLSFMRNGEKLMSDFLPGVQNKGRHVLNEVNQTYLLLEISDVEVEDAGTYTCASNNSVGYDEKGIDLVVQYAPVFVGYKSSLKRMHAWPGVSINMSCRVRAVPRPVVQWFVRRNTPGDGGEDGYQVVHDGGKVYKVFESEEGPLLQITVEKKDDEISSDNHTDVRDKNIDDDERNIFSEYMCKAVNDVGANHMEFVLDRAYAPAVPKVGINKTRADQIIIAVDAVENGDEGNEDDDGVSKVLRYFVQYHVDGGKSTPDPMSRVFNADERKKVAQLVVDQLLPNTTYMVHVSSLNVVGKGHPAILKVTTVPPGPPEPVTLTSSNVVPGVNYLLLSWQPPYFGGAPIKEYIVSHRKVELLSDGVYNPLNDWSHGASTADERADHVIINDNDVLGNADSKLNGVQISSQLQTQNSSFLKFNINRLEPGSYQVRIVATNVHGQSRPNEDFYISTLSGSDDDLNYLPNLIRGHYSISQIVMIGFIVFTVIIIFVTIIDVSCYLINGCGLTMILCIRICNRQPTTLSSSESNKLKAVDSAKKSSSDVFGVLKGVTNGTGDHNGCSKGATIDEEENARHLGGGGSAAASPSAPHYPTPPTSSPLLTQRPPGKSLPLQQLEPLEKELIDFTTPESDKGLNTGEDHDDVVGESQLPLPPPPSSLTSSSYSPPLRDQTTGLILPKNRKSIMSCGDARWKDVVSELESQLGVRKPEAAFEIEQDEDNNMADDYDDHYDGPPSPKWKVF